MLAQPWVDHVGRIVSSAETKPFETAELLAGHLGLAVEVRPDTGRSIVQRPASCHQRSSRRWPTQASPTLRCPRVAGSGRSTRRLASPAPADVLTAAAPDVVVVGHGGVGTFWYCDLTGWYCDLTGVPLERRLDQLAWFKGASRPSTATTSS